MFGSECKAVGVAYGAAAVIVVEIDVHVLAPVPQVGETTGPIREGRPAVAGSRVCSALVQSHISPIGRAPERGLPLRGVTEAEAPLRTAARCPQLRRCTTIRGAARTPL